jgi:hypothetical protein
MKMDRRTSSVCGKVYTEIAPSSGFPLDLEHLGFRFYSFSISKHVHNLYYIIARLYRCYTICFEYFDSKILQEVDDPLSVILWYYISRKHTRRNPRLSVIQRRPDDA